MNPVVIAANRLIDGVAVWFDVSGCWVEDISAASILDRVNLESAVAAAKLDGQNNIVINLREVAVEVLAPSVMPVSLRERIVASGPTARQSLDDGRAGAVRDDGLLLQPSPSHQAGLYQYDAYDRQFLRERADRFRDQVERRLSGALSEEEFRPLRLMNGLYHQLHAYMLRVALPYGVLSAVQMRKLAYVARRFDRCYGHFTTRQNLQFNWIRLEDVPEILATLAEADLHAIQTSGNCVRNVTTDHFAGAAADEIVDPRLYAEVLRQWSTDHPEFTYLPRKFKIAITGSPIDRAAVRVHDIGLLAIRNEQGECGFQVYAGGGLGRTPTVGVMVRNWLPAKDLLRYVEAILRVYNSLGRRDNIYKARIKILIREIKPEIFIGLIEDEFAAMSPTYSVLSDEIIDAISGRFNRPPFERDLAIECQELDRAMNADRDFGSWVNSNTNPHRHTGYCSVIISLKPPGGIPGDASAEEMEFVADLADTYSFGEMRVAHQQNLVLPHVRREDLHGLWLRLREQEMATSNIGYVSDIISCPGMDYCSLATTRSIPVAQRLSERFASPQVQREIGKLDLHISGCINACGHHHVAHIGLLGVEKNGEEFYQITLGGSADENAAIGAIIGPAIGSDDIVDAIDAIIAVYMVERRESEPFIDFYRRVGAEPFKEALYARD